MNNYNFKKFKRVSKATARRLFDNGDIIRIAPCKVNIDNEIFYLDITRKTHGSDFDKFVNECAYYNCNGELGYYLSYYVYK